MRSRSTITLSLFLGAWISCATVWAQDGAWRPIRYSSRTGARSRPITDRAPPATLGMPVVKRRAAPEEESAHSLPAPSQPRATRPAGWGRPRGASREFYAQHNLHPAPRLDATPAAPNRVVVASTLLPPTFRAQGPPDSAPPPGGGGAIGPPPGIPADPLIGSEPFNTGAIPAWDQPVAPKGKFGSKVMDYLFASSDPNRTLFESDKGFNTFSSPITSPFFSEDPRALTEVRPIFIYQDVPNSNPAFNGGDVIFYGLQGRVAINERFSIVLNKLGGISFDPDNKTSGFDDDSSFSEIWIGPKVTFIRNQDTNTLLAAGATFQIPAGSSKVAQDTGSLSIAPYLSFAQGFNIFDRGPINFMTTLGYAFSTDSQRSEYVYANFHLDYNILGKVFPTLELNWTHYTANGGLRPFGFEGGDLINFGSTNVDGSDLISLAPGVRYKFSECVQVGAALEFPLTGDDQFNDFRMTFDVILRY